MADRTDRMLRANAFAILLLASSSTSAVAQAQAPTPPPPAPPSEGGRAPAPRPADAAPTGQEEEEGAPSSVSGVVVNGHRTQYGAVVGDIKPELQLSPADIQSYGVSSVTELLAELSPQTRSDRGRGSGSPVVLLNGRRISSFNEIQNIPTEAIQRVDILPEEVSLKYGYTADQRVVNIVLRRRFRAITGEAKGGGPTEGGEAQGQAEADLLRLRNDDRLNLDLKLTGASGLTDQARGVGGPTAGQLVSSAGNITSTTPGAQIDPALSALAGAPVTVAGVPASAAMNAPALSAFGPTAGVATVTDASRDRTLSPATRQATLNGVLARSTLGGIAVTVNGTLGVSRSESLQGLPSAVLVIPNGDPFSPFSSPVNLYRYVGDSPLHQTTESWTGHLGVTANKDRGPWRLSLTAAYDHGDSLTTSQTGVSSAPAQALLNSLSPSFNPFAALTGDLTPALPLAKARTLTNSANAQFLANGPLTRLPAGDLYASFKVGDTVSLIGSRTDRAGAITTADLTRNVFNAQMNLDLPLTSRRNHVLSGFGEFALNGNFAIDQVSDFGTLLTLGYGFNWTPVTGVNLIVSRTHDHQVPSLQQLDNPVTVTPGTRLFDYATGQTVDVTAISGGDRALRADTRDVLKIGLTLKPLPDRDLTLSANYIDSEIRNAVASLPAATAQVEAAFPNRFIRNAAGDLVEVDETPVNFADERRKELRWGVNFAMPLATPAPVPGDGFRPPYPRPTDGAPGGSGGSGRGGGGASGARRGGFGGFGQRDAQAGRFQVAVYHTVYFADQIQARPGAPVFDLLNGASVGTGGGQVRHEIEGQLGFTRFGFGVRFSADWKSATLVDGGSPATDLAFSDIGTVNLRLWNNFAVQRSILQRWPILRGTRLTLEATNLLDTRQSVRDATGLTPLSYQPAYLDPSGRVVQLSLRKLFF